LSLSPAPRREGLTIGVARDEAFCFLYEDNLRYLERRGCRLVFFSPMRDERLPEMDGMIFCGGYPELYAKALSGNRAMLTAVRERLLSGLPCIAECGGFLYLQKELTDEVNKTYEMAGVFPGRGYRGRGLERFGYIDCSVRKGRLFGLEGMRIRAHEFHYYQCDNTGDALTARKASGEKEWTTGIVNDNLYAGFPHIYFYGNEIFAEAFLERAAACRRRRLQAADRNDGSERE